jgi:predicted alpha/beta-fold hydrolase
VVADSFVAGEYRYRPAWWLPGGHAQTLWGKFARPREILPLVREEISLPDGDKLELHTYRAPPKAPRLLLLHGLEGTIASHYVGGILAAAAEAGWGATLMVFRGCGSAPNTARRFYHSGETTDVAHVYSVLRQRAPEAQWFAIGVSLGGNVLLKWLGESGTTASLAAAAAISVPFDLESGARTISTGFAQIYDRNFLTTLRQKALHKLTLYPDLFDRAALLRAKNVFDFDEVVTAPVHGFAGAHDYYEKSSSLSFLPRIRVPTLLLSARDDPFLPPSVLDRVTAVVADNPSLTADFVSRGGHVGFVGGAWPWAPTYYAERRAVAFLQQAGGSRQAQTLP